MTGRHQSRNELSILDKPWPALPVFAEAANCSEEDALNGLRALIEAGYIVAPMEPTNAMLIAYLQTYCCPTHARSVLRGAAKARRRWKAMAQAGLAMAMSRRYISEEGRQFARTLAKAMEARRAEPGTGSVHDSAVAESDLPE